MTIEEVSRVLAKIKLGDNREVNELVIAEWADSIGFLRYEDAIEAVRLHRRESIDYLQPAHIVRNVKRIRERLSLESAATECSEHWGYPLPCARCRRDAEEVEA